MEQKSINKLVYCVYLHYSSKCKFDSPMATKRNHIVKDNYDYYNQLLNKRKSIFSEVIEIKKVGNNHNTLEEPVVVKHPDIENNMILLVDVKINNNSFFQFKLRYKEFIDNPIFRFDSDGDTHRNRIDGVPLEEQQVLTPHFHKFNENGIEIAYKTDLLKNEETCKALEDIEYCIAHFFHECNIRLNEESFPSVKIMSNPLGFSFQKEDPNQNIVFP